MAVIVEAMRPFLAGTYEVRPGARLLAWNSPAGWHVIFNGNDILVPAGTVGEVDSAEVKRAAEERKSARDEEYQSAPTKNKA